MCKLTYPRLKHCLKALHIMNTKCHALVMGNRIENHNRILVILGYTYSIKNNCHICETFRRSLTKSLCTRENPVSLVKSLKIVYLHSMSKITTNFHKLIFRSFIGVALTKNKTKQKKNQKKKTRLTD